MVRVTVDRAQCQGHGCCYGFFPELFEPDDEGYAVVLGDPGLADSAAREAADVCPERAILVQGDR